MSTVIKAGEAGRIVQRLSTVDLADHLAEARAYVDEAKRQAAQVVVDVKAQAKRGHAEAKKTGHEEGYKQGHAEGVEAGNRQAYEDAIGRFEKDQGDLVGAMQRAIGEIDKIKQDLRIAAERDTLEFAVFIAKKLTFEIGKLHPESAMENLRRALRLVESKTDLTIHMHPNDIASAETFAKTVLEQAGASRAASIVPDESLSPGGCRVESGRTGVDAALETQVAEVVSLLLGGEASDD